MKALHRSEDAIESSRKIEPKTTVRVAGNPYFTKAHTMLRHFIRFLSAVRFILLKGKTVNWYPGPLLMMTWG